VDRRSTGLSESPPELCDDGALVVAESPCPISAFGVPSSELETARRRRLTVVLLLSEEALDELLAELFVEGLLIVPSELEGARCSLGRSGSSSFDELEFDELEFDELRSDELPEELFDELLVPSSELDGARRSVGLLPLLLPLEATEELLAGRLDDALADDALAEEGEPSEGRAGSGRVGSSAATDAMECSSAVPSDTIVILAAW
jgi:hypothetical protein